MTKRNVLILLAAALASGVTLGNGNEPENFLVAPPPTVLFEAPAPPSAESLYHSEARRLMLLAQAPKPAPPVALNPAVPGKPRGVSSRLPHIEAHYAFGLASGPRSLRSLVIPKDDMNPETLAAMEEDLNVMSVILEKAVGQRSEDERKIMGIDIFSGGSESPRNLFIEGHGVIFMLKTKLALTPPAAKMEETNATEPANSEWEDARRQLYGPAEWEREIHKAFKHVRGLETAAAYDEDKVTELKNSVIESLRNAANMRGLKGDHTVTVAINGPGSRSGSAARVERGSGGRIEARSEASGSSNRGAVMIIQAKKADIDEFARNSNEESFRKKVKIHIY